MLIQKLSTEDRNAYTEYVVRAAEGSFYHTLAWHDAVIETYGLEPHYLIAYDGGLAIGVLPLFLIRSRLMGDRLISVPYSNYAGPLADTVMVQQALVAHASKLAEDLDVDHLELRNVEAQDYPRLVPGGGHVTLRLNLIDEERQFAALKKRTRRYVRKAQESVAVDTETKDVNSFYRIYTRRMKRLGSPVHPKRFFESLLTHGGDNVLIPTASIDGTPVASIFLLRHGTRIVYAWGAAEARYEDHQPNYALFWETLKYLKEHGVKEFDFGRSLPGSGTHFFKEGWGAVPVQLAYRYLLRKGTKPPRVSQASYKRKILAAAWRLLPSRIAAAISGRIRKVIG
ncbi:GNAT family N-acetyltransferase [Candidatus Woesearchaeota archaeon]|nr:GNAT family N-acetyltransferase [Candidatus Woesearchaeota archaeon]